jgi:hypothetical protein
VTRTGSSKPLAQTGSILSMIAHAPTLSTHTFWFRWKTVFAIERARLINLNRRR